MLDAFSVDAQQKFAKPEKKAAPPSRKRGAEEGGPPAAKPKKPRKPKKAPPSADELAAQQAAKTPGVEIFVGNLPLATKTKDVEKLFKGYGAVASVRLRSLPVAGTAVDVAGDHNLMKKICAFRGKLSDAKDSVNAYGVCAHRRWRGWARI